MEIFNLSRPALGEAATQGRFLDAVPVRDILNREALLAVDKAVLKAHGFRFRLPGEPRTGKSWPTPGVLPLDDASWGAVAHAFVGGVDSAKVLAHVWATMTPEDEADLALVDRTLSGLDHRNRKVRLTARRDEFCANYLDAGAIAEAMNLPLPSRDPMYPVWNAQSRDLAGIGINVDGFCGRVMRLMGEMGAVAWMGDYLTAEERAVLDSELARIQEASYGSGAVPPSFSEPVDPYTFCPAVDGIRYVNGMITAERERRIGVLRAESVDVDALCADAFFRPPGAEMWWLSWETGPESGLYGFDLNAPWGLVRQTVKNIDTARRALKDYPWPAMFLNWGADWWFQSDYNGCPVCPIDNKPLPRAYVNMIASGDDLTEEAVRVFVTLSILMNLPQMNANLVHYYKSQAKKIARELKIVKIVFVVVGVALSFCGLPLGASAIVGRALNSVDKSITNNALREVKAYANTLKGALTAEFQGADPAFAAEVDRVGNLLTMVAEYGDKMVTEGASVPEGQIPVPNAPAGTPADPAAGVIPPPPEVEGILAPPSTASRLLAAGGVGAAGIAALALAGIFKR